MKKFVVAYINFFDNELKLNIIEAENWSDAIMKAGYGDYGICNSLEETQEHFWNSDALINVLEIE
jgi:hypothetical protein